MNYDIAPPVLTPAASRVAQAAVAVIAGRGLDQLSVRSVAAQLGMSGGAVQHHFPSRTDLLRAAMGVVVSSMSDRMGRSAAPSATRTPREVLFSTLREALPLDELRRSEGAVWVALSAAASVHPELRDLHRSYYMVFVDAVAELIADAHPDMGVTVTIRARTLAATVDGLTLQGITGNLSTDAMTDVLTRAVADALATR